MSDEMTTRPMLEALLEGQRQLASQLVDSLLPNQSRKVARLVEMAK